MKGQEKKMISSKLNSKLLEEEVFFLAVPVYIKKNRKVDLLSFFFFFFIHFQGVVKRLLHVNITTVLLCVYARLSDFLKKDGRLTWEKKDDTALLYYQCVHSDKETRPLRVQ